MKTTYIPLPTDTPEGREIVKALTLQKGDDGIWLHIEATRFKAGIQLGKQPNFVWEAIKEFLGDEKSIRLTLPCPQCTCVFDSEGWRRVEDRTGFIPDDGIRYSISPIHHKTKCHESDRPCIKKESLNLKNEFFHADVANATAPQRCEAFLRTVQPGKWEEIVG